MTYPAFPRPLPVYPSRIESRRICFFVNGTTKACLVALGPLDTTDFSRGANAALASVLTPLARARVSSRLDFVRGRERPCGERPPPSEVEVRGLAPAS